MWKRHTLYFLAKKPLRNLKMPSGCKRERNVFTILNFCVTRYRLFDDTQELRQEWKLEKIKSSFFFKNFFVCYTPGYDMGYLPIFVENMVVLGIFFFINLWWFSIFSIFFNFRFIRRNVCYHLQKYIFDVIWQNSFSWSAIRISIFFR